MSRRERLTVLKDASPAVLPSLLLCDFGNLASEVQKLEDAGVAGLHLDVMDGHFVPNLTYGMPIVEGIRRLTDIPLDVHLMIDRPERYVHEFVKAGADIVTVHIEACERPADILGQIRDYGVGAGIALNPATSVEQLDDCLDLADLVLVMSVPAGFGGQGFQDVALDKLAQLRKRVRSDVMLEVDGGVNSATISRCVTAGAELLVVGSAIFREDDYPRAVRKLRDLASAA